MASSVSERGSYATQPVVLMHVLSLLPSVTRRPVPAGFPCRCGGIFCSTHRYANEHSCSFDYKEHGAEEIRKNNPQVVGEKITKI